jgi:hypothetical protein
MHDTNATYATKPQAFFAVGKMTKVDLKESCNKAGRKRQHHHERTNCVEYNSTRHYQQNTNDTYQKQIHSAVHNRQLAKSMNSYQRACLQQHREHY